jgi:hypothetical protein
LLEKAICPPSGDHAGPVSNALSFVRLVCAEPSAFIV